MKILSYSPTYYGAGHNAGAETTLHGINVAVKRAGHTVLALVSRPHKDGSGSFVLDGIHVQAFGSKQDPELHFPRYDLILTQFECAQRAWYIGLKYDIPTVQIVHNNTEYATKLALRYNDALIYNTHHVAADINRQFANGTAKPFAVVHPVIDPRQYEVETTREYITLVNLSNGEEPFYNKGYETFYHLAEKFPNEKFMGVLGAYGDQVVRRLPNVTIVPHTDNILNVYRKSKVILMPSEIESYGRVAIEAACSAIPSITSTAPGFKESGIGHYMVPFNAFDEWEVALSRLLDEYSYAAYLAKDKAHKIFKSTSCEVNDLNDFLEKARSK